MDIRKSRAPKIHMAEAHEHKEGEEHAHPEPELPEFNDDFVRALGPFKDVADFKEKLKVNIKLEKENQQKKKKLVLKLLKKLLTTARWMFLKSWSTLNWTKFYTKWSLISPNGTEI